MRRYHYYGPQFEENGMGELPYKTKPWYLQSRVWLGIICPMLLGGYGLFSIVTLHSFHFTGSFRCLVIEFFGLDAVYSGVVYLMGGAFFHFNYYWKQSEKLFKYAAPLTYLSVMIGGSFLTLIFFWHSLTMVFVFLCFAWIYLLIMRALR